MGYGEKGNYNMLQKEQVIWGASHRPNYELSFFQGSSIVLVYPSAWSSNSYFYNGITSRNPEKGEGPYVSVCSQYKTGNRFTSIQHHKMYSCLFSVSQSKFLRAEGLHPLSLDLLFLNTARLSVYRWVELQENKFPKEKHAIFWTQRELMCANMQKTPKCSKIQLYLGKLMLLLEEMS